MRGVSRCATPPSRSPPKNGFPPLRILDRLCQYPRAMSADFRWGLYISSLGGVLAPATSARVRRIGFCEGIALSKEICGVSFASLRVG